jgi:hypothetical protein
MDHEGPGVVPGRYPGEPIVLHEGPTPQQTERAAERAEADALAGRVRAAAAVVARSECELLELVGEFDATGAVRFWSDVTSVAQTVRPPACVEALFTMRLPADQAEAA